ncbi:hypothetical protein pb186bvf_014668 [Paramecium bursaria]
MLIMEQLRIEQILQFPVYLRITSCQRKISLYQKQNYKDQMIPQILSYLTKEKLRINLINYL